MIMNYTECRYLIDKDGYTEDEVIQMLCKQMAEDKEAIVGYMRKISELEKLLKGEE